MLFGGVVHHDVDLAEFINCLLHDFLAELFVTDVAVNEQTLASMPLNHLLSLSRILVLL